jgi:predicted RND superfamily exporter protein
VRDLGLFTAFGVLASYGLTFSLAPTLLRPWASVTPQPPSAEPWWTPARAEALTGWILRRRWPLLAAGAALGLAGCLGVARLQVESNVLSFFPADHPVRTSYGQIEQHLLGLTPVQLWLEGPLDEALGPATLEQLDQLVAPYRADHPLVTGVASPLDLPGLESLAYADRAALARALFADAPPPGAETLVQRRGDRVHVRVTLTCRTSSDEAFNRFAAELRARAEAGFDGAVRCRVTGALPILVRVQSLLVETQLRSFAVALGLVTLVLAAYFRRVGVVAVSLVPNVLPILVTLGVMGHGGISLNTATVTVAGIAFGLVVADTIHFLHEYQRERGRGATSTAAVAHTLFTVGRPLVTTSVAVSAGFACFCLTPSSTSGS